MSNSRRISLPSEDSDPKLRRDQLDEDRDRYRYRFDLLPGVAMARKVLPENKSTARWFGLAGKSMLVDKNNKLKLKWAWEGSTDVEMLRGDDDEPDPDQEALIEHEDFFANMDGFMDGETGDQATMRGGDDTFSADNEEAWRDEAEYRLSQECSLFRTLPGSDDEEDGDDSRGMAVADDDDDEDDDDRGLKQVIMGVGPNGRPEKVDNYRDLHVAIELPKIAEELDDDSSFARLQTQGFNALEIRAVTAPPEHFPVTEAHYQAVIGDDDSLERAGAEGRLFLADYAPMSELIQTDYRGLQKYAYAPLALFATPLGGRELKAVAIQCDQTPDPETNPVFTPATTDHWRWRMAKTVVNVTSANQHELVQHLGRTHLLVQPCVMATHRELAKNHPVHVLLAPHIEGTIYINDMAANNLIAKDGEIDVLFSATIESSQTTAIKGLATFPFEDAVVPKRLAKFGVANPETLPVYPYRDDALRVWAAIEEWVTSYLNHYYKGSDAAVAGDIELQAWARTLSPASKGGLLGFGPVDTLAALIEAVTVFIFTASAQHAAVNFPQKGIMSYAPAISGACWAPAPTASSEASEQRWLDMLPALELAEYQNSSLYQLGSLYYTQLGRYNEGHFTDGPVANEMVVAFQRRLQDVEREIEADNTDASKRTQPYRYLLPSEIPQSINI